MFSQNADYKYSTRLLMLVVGQLENGGSRQERLQIETECNIIRLVDDPRRGEGVLVPGRGRSGISLVWSGTFVGEGGSLLSGQKIADAWHWWWRSGLRRFWPWRCYLKSRTALFFHLDTLRL